MKSTLILTMAVAVLAGCQQSSSSGGAATQSTAQPVAPVASSSATQTLPKFEVRDFKLEKRISDEITTFEGRGTLVAKDDALKKGNYMVWLSVKLVEDNDETTRQLILLLRDGIGTIEITNFVAYGDQKKKEETGSQNDLFYRVVGCNKTGVLLNAKYQVKTENRNRVLA